MLPMKESLLRRKLKLHDIIKDNVFVLSTVLHHMPKFSKIKLHF